VHHVNKFQSLVQRTSRSGPSPPSLGDHGSHPQSGDLYWVQSGCGGCLETAPKYGFGVVRVTQLEPYPGIERIQGECIDALRILFAEERLEACERSLRLTAHQIDLGQLLLQPPSELEIPGVFRPHGTLLDVRAANLVLSSCQAENTEIEQCVRRCP
jgi:hypothetical protein